MKHILKDLFFWWYRTGLGSRASILRYHNIGRDDAFFTVTPEAFERQLQYLKDEGFEVCSLRELVERVREGKDIGGCVVLTFNDGYCSFYSEVLPRIQKFQFPITVFLTIDILDSTIQTSEGHTFKTLAPKEIREMIETGLVEFMPQIRHTVPLDSVSFQDAIEHIEQARKGVESLTKQDAPIFGYSRSTPSERMAEHLRSHDWIGAVAGNEGLVHPHTDTFFLPRNAVDSRTTFAQFKGKVSGAIEEYVEVRKR